MAKGKADEPLFIGLDLAWSSRNTSGIAVIQGGRLRAQRGNLGDDGQILNYLRGHLTADLPAIVAIDAPLKVPNESGSRRCDRELSADWRRYQAGALPANRRLLARDSQVRGEVLVEELVHRFRFTLSSVIPRRTRDRLICEVYPHPAMVSLFGLEHTYKYKARGGRDYLRRWAEMGKYQASLRSLRREGDPPLKGTKELLTATDVSQLRGRALKQVEDMLDAVTCAYVAYYLWYHGPRRAITYGSVAEGHIVVPVTQAMRTRLGRAELAGPHGRG